jgi:hypothetical protein
MARQGAVAALILLLAACTSSSSRPSAGKGDPSKTGGSGELDVSVDVETIGGSPREGDLATLIFKIHNGCKNTILLRDLTQPRDLMLAGSSAAVITWQFAQAGQVTYSVERDEWVYEKGRKADVGRPIFNSGLLVADESLVVRAQVRLLEMPMDFQFSYFELSLDEVRRKVYFEFREQKIARYRTLIGRELEDRLVPSLRTDEAGHRFVVFPHAEPVASNPLLKTVRLQQPLRPRYFTLDQACRKAGVPKPRLGTYSYSIVLDGWILPKDQGHVLVAPTLLQPLPELRQMERSFHFVDAIVPEKITVQIRAHSIASALGDLKYRLVKDEKEVPISSQVKEKRVIYYLYLTSEQLLKFLADLKALKLVLDIEYRDGHGYLVAYNN